MFMVPALILADLLALILAVALGVATKAIVEGPIEIAMYLRLWPLLFVFPAVYKLMGLYSDMALSAPEELQRTAIASTMVFMTLAALTTTFRGAETSFTWTLGVAIALSVVFVPLTRAAAKSMLASLNCWGHPTVIFGGGLASSAAIDAMRRHPEAGLKPILIVERDELIEGNTLGLPVIAASNAANTLAALGGPYYAVVATDYDQQGYFLGLVEKCVGCFERVLLIPRIDEASCLSGNPRILAGMVGLEIDHLPLSSTRVRLKRFVDLFLVVSASIFVLPFAALIALMIKLDSPGPVFYAQRRIGRNGKRFFAWKFRSMVKDAPAVLEQYLNQHPELRQEWERDHKLRNDPRVTRIGRFLRRTSLDELPQLWNVLRGDMSLVGPRPIVEEEIVRYGPYYPLYTRVLGGVTGLWQVSGRSDTSYEERVQLDIFYARNWSVWLDLCILFRTISVVLFRKGAY